MNSNIKYLDIEFCTNLLFNAIYGENDNCYQIQPIDKKNIKMEDLRKPLDYAYSDIFKGNLKFLGYYNNRIHYKVSQHFHPYEIAIGLNNLNINDININDINIKLCKKKQKINETYNCTLHDDTKEICLVYNCLGNINVNDNIVYNYIK